MQVREELYYCNVPCVGDSESASAALHLTATGSSFSLSRMRPYVSQKGERRLWLDDVSVKLIAARRACLNNVGRSDDYLAQICC